MKAWTLNGTWQLTQSGTADTIPATVPGSVYHDLRTAGNIPDPYYRRNEKVLQWIGQRAWVYARSFDVSPDMLAMKNLTLRCRGLDTLCTVTLNGTVVGKTDNQYRTYEFDIHDIMRRGTNTIEVICDSVFPYIKKLQKRRAVQSPQSVAHEPPGRSLVRKQPCNFGWDWGPVLVTCGIWRDIEILGWNQCRIENMHHRQHHKKDSAQVIVETELSRKVAGCHIEVELSYSGKTVATATGPAAKKTSLKLRVTKPKLWWPNGMGEQCLYELAVTVLDSSGTVIDRARTRIGLRTLKLVRKKDRWGQSFHFEANGVPFFAKGSNWIPADAILPRLDAERYRVLLRGAADTHQNMIRVWGGGIYEEDLFYDLCDELGLCVWQDFMFACASYPADFPAFMTNVKAEVEDNVTRIRHHACLALWCGNNELEMWITKWGRDFTWPNMPEKEYEDLFDKLIPSVTRRLDPRRDYWPSSPHTPVGDRNEDGHPDSGDAHLWGVWHGKEPFEWYRTTLHRFCSEFGFQSFPEPKTVATYTTAPERNITSPTMEWHQRSGIGNATIMHYLLSWFRMPKNFESTLWLSQIQQGLAMKYAVEHWRRNMPRCMGALYWQLNDCWPVASWASIDYYGRWKALHYMARQFFAPLLISGVEQPEKKRVAIHVTSDDMQAQLCEARWEITTVAGDTLSRGKKALNVKPRSASRIAYLDCSKELETHGEENILVWLRLYRGTELVSHNLVHFARVKGLELEKPSFRVTVKKASAKSFLLTIAADKPALWTWVESRGIDGVLSDNFFSLRTHEKREIVFTPAGSYSLERVKKGVRVGSLYSTYR